MVQVKKKLSFAPLSLEACMACDLEASEIWNFQILVLWYSFVHADDENTLEFQFWTCVNLEKALN
jgi:hypothetical protein